ncbi:hypothetical protein V8G54_006792 [Vigna mungo]|uniref:VHS domain-containing protein n=1 Tax=Vigna mungo TaxID=3915 RepID=A0AAQ3P0M4_VIGMU
MPMAVLFGKLREHELELNRVSAEEAHGKKKTLAFKTENSKGTSSEKDEESEDEDSDDENMIHILFFEIRFVDADWIFEDLGGYRGLEIYVIASVFEILQVTGRVVGKIFCMRVELRVNTIRAQLDPCPMSKMKISKSELKIETKNQDLSTTQIEKGDEFVRSEVWHSEARLHTATWTLIIVANFVIDFGDRERWPLLISLCYHRNRSLIAPENFDPLVAGEKRCSMLVGPDWALNMEICDILNRDPGGLDSAQHSEGGVILAKTLMSKLKSDFGRVGGDRQSHFGGKGRRPLNTCCPGSMARNHLEITNGAMFAWANRWSAFQVPSVLTEALHPTVGQIFMGPIDAYLG